MFYKLSYYSVVDKKIFARILDSPPAVTSYYSTLFSATCAAENTIKMIESQAPRKFYPIHYPNQSSVKTGIEQINKEDYIRYILVVTNRDSREYVCNIMPRRLYGKGLLYCLLQNWDEFWEDIY